MFFKAKMLTNVDVLEKMRSLGKSSQKLSLGINFIDLLTNKQELMVS